MKEMKEFKLFGDQYCGQKVFIGKFVLRRGTVRFIYHGGQEKKTVATKHLSGNVQKLSTPSLSLTVFPESNHRGNEGLWFYKRRTKEGVVYELDVGGEGRDDMGTYFTIEKKDWDEMMAFVRKHLKK